MTLLQVLVAGESSSGAACGGLWQGSKQVQCSGILAIESFLGSSAGSPSPPEVLSDSDSEAGARGRAASVSARRVDAYRRRTLAQRSGAQLSAGRGLIGGAASGRIHLLSTECGCQAADSGCVTDREVWDPVAHARLPLSYRAPGLQ